MAMMFDTFKAMEQSTVYTNEIFQLSANNGTFIDAIERHIHTSNYDTGLTLIRIVFPIIVLLGSVGNFLIVLVLRRGAINIDNLSFFLSALAVVDTIFIYTSACKTWVRVMWDLEFLHWGTWACKVGLFLNQVCPTMSAWLVVVISWQRWYTCSRPFDRCCPVERTMCGYAGVALLTVLLVAANSYVLFTAELYKTENSSFHVYTCEPGAEHEVIISEVFPYVLFGLYSVLPATLLIFLNALLARVLYVSRRALLTQPERARQRDEGQLQARCNYVTILLMALSISWLILTCPHTIFKMVEHPPTTSEEEGKQLLLNVVFFILLYTNHSINFFLYCALTKGFRREVAKMASSVKSFTCALSGSCCCCFRQRGQNLDGSVSDNHQCHTDSVMPLLEQIELKYRQTVVHNGIEHGAKPMTVV